MDCQVCISFIHSFDCQIAQREEQETYTFILHYAGSIMHVNEDLKQHHSLIAAMQSQRELKKFQKLKIITS